MYPHKSGILFQAPLIAVIGCRLTPIQMTVVKARFLLMAQVLALTSNILIRVQQSNEIMGQRLLYLVEYLMTTQAT